VLNLLAQETGKEYDEAAQLLHRASAACAFEKVE
jgi:hypothetical protein